MRGIEGALFALQGAREGRFVSETLRALGDRGEIALRELSLASSLAYAAVRREALWQEMFGAYIGKSRTGKLKLAPVVSDCLLLGAAGLLELQTFAGGALVNGLLEILKNKGQAKAVPMVNAILRNIARDGESTLEKLRNSPKQDERALWAGVPVWSLPAWRKTWGNEELTKLFDLTRLPPRASLRTPPGQRDELLALLEAASLEGVPSDLFPDSIRLPGTVLPPLVPGFDRGLATVQTESSMLAASAIAEFGEKTGGLILDMCSGRGVKAGQIAQALAASRPSPRLECWEISSGRHRAAAREMERLGTRDSVTLRLGNALSLEPAERPSVVFLDAPCSGSGTWNRKPESKWRLNWAKLDQMGELQRALLRRALSLTAPGGVIIYITCSLLRQENENVVADILSEKPEGVVLELPWTGSHTRRGRPWGTYIWPILPWLDGFYAAVIMKRAEV
ncbi:MAG: RsmB/NOP family class I SAM-dependent RNA methyltransferase [Synergistaceae bacterium]|nr:RsmB/NOP family class I SAM-dependent RNA methyltransferase [Synergistaceae bacterium]